MSHSHTADKLGLVLSAACALHCALTPLAVLAFPTLGFLEDSETVVHLTLAAVLVLVTGLAFYRGFRHHARKDILFQAVVGLLLVCLALIAPEMNHGYPISLEAFMTLTGSGILISAHLRNWQQSGCCLKQKAITPLNDKGLEQTDSALHTHSAATSS